MGPAGVGSLGRTGQPPDAHTPPPLPPGLCGNFNQNQADDFRTVSGVVEATAAAFANTWKTQAACPNVKNSFEDPCSLSVENGVCPAAPGPLDYPGSGPGSCEAGAGGDQVGGCRVLGRLGAHPREGACCPVSSAHLA